MNRELFGTDGLRGLAGQYPLDQTGANQVGRAVGSYFAKPGQQVVIGRDPRESSEELAAALTAGLTAVGVNVTSVGVITTPGLAYLARQGQFVAGVMVTASHNLYQYNGVKVFDANGDKLTDVIEVQLNNLIKDGVADRGVGTVANDDKLIQGYEDFLVSSAAGLSLGGQHLAVDTANGAASGLAQRVFSRLGAEITPLFDAPDGRNINAGCGATDTKALSQSVVANKLDLGIALDGDADRLALVDGQGRVVNGDCLMYLLAVTGKLEGVVATVMSNFGLELALRDRGIALERVQVGDRYVLEGLKRTGFAVGGEQSGHIIFPKLLATGDGLLAAIQVVQALNASNTNLAQWRDKLKLLPQALVNIPLADKAQLERPDIQAFIQRQAGNLGENGRLLIRPSGTEPLARVMVEAPDAQEIAEKIAADLQTLVSNSPASGSAG